MLHRKEEVQSSVAEFAESYGNKSANLIQLTQLCQHLMNQDNQLKVQVPSICPLQHDLIYYHLTKHAPQWLSLWKDFIKEQKKDAKDLSDKSIQIIKQLQELILNTFQKNVFHFSLVNDYLEKLNINLDLLMVRSTGKEDSKELANPGGNESVSAVKADEKSISEAIGIVVASYFSEKSLKQRLLGKDDITQPPFIPVLLQKMEGEKLGGAKEIDKVIRSGVMYSGKRGTRIQVAPGHGELIVNSKAPFDSIYVSREGVVHSEIHQKPQRLIPKEIKTATGVKRTLEMADNVKALKNTPSLPDHVIRRLANIGQSIEDHYGEPMDVEFVYEPATDIINIVQARPIPTGDLHLFPPSSIRLDKLAELKTTAPIQKGSVVTAGGSAAKVITSKDEIIVCQTIEEALTQYLSQRDSKVKAVIIKNDAPETSHEAAQFNSKAIPVLRVDDINNVQEALKQENIALIIDPQRKQIVDVNKLYDKSAPDKVKAIETAFLQEGIFKSTMSAQESLQDFIPNRDFKYSTFYRKPKRIPIGKMLDDIRSKKSAVANEAFNNLMRTLYEVIKDGPTKPALFKDMPMLLEEIENAIPGKNNEKAFAALQMILNRFVRLSKSLEKEDKTIDSNKSKQMQIIKEKHKTRKALFKQAMLTGAEIFHILEEMREDKSNKVTEGASSRDSKETKSDIKSQRLELLNLIAKLEALISAPARPGLFSSSLYQWAVEQKLRKKAQSISGYRSLSAEKQEYFILLLQMSNLALNKSISEAWKLFALIVCQDENKLFKLAEVIQFMQKFNITSDWINERFFTKIKDMIMVTEEYFVNKLKTTKTAEEKKADLQKFEEIINTTFDNMMKEIAQTKTELEKLDSDNKAELLASWEQKLTHFADEEKFPTLWKAFNTEIIPLIDQLDIKSDMQPLTQQSIINLVLQLTELMDHSIKSMKGSPTYKNKTKQVENFYAMLEPYLRLMKKWVEKVPDTVFSRCSAALNDRQYMNSKNRIISDIESTFNTKKYYLNEGQLLPSTSFAVAPACFDSGASFARHFVDLSSSLTLEDLFTLMHQNILSATHQVKAQSKTTTPVMPETLQPLLTSLESIRCAGNQPKLLKAEHQYPLLFLEYNLTLRNHSAKFLIVYDQALGTCKVQAKYFGHNQGARMDIIKEMANLFPLFQNIKNVQPAVHNSSKRVVDFAWELTPTQLAQFPEKLKNEFATFAEVTFYDYSSGNEKYNFLNRNLAGRSDITLKQVQGLYQAFHLQYSIGIEVSSAIKTSCKLWQPKSLWLDLDLINSSPLQDLFIEALKSFSKEETLDFAAGAIKLGKLEFFNFLPADSIPKENLERSTIESYIAKLKKLYRPSDWMIKVLFKFSIDIKDLMSTLEMASTINTFDIINTIKDAIKSYPKETLKHIATSALQSGNFELLALLPDADFPTEAKVDRKAIDNYFLKIKDNFSWNNIKILFKLQLDLEDLVYVMITSHSRLGSYFLENLKDSIKSYPKEKFSYITSEIIKAGKLELLYLIPDNAISEAKFDSKTIENYFTNTIRDGYGATWKSIVPLFKFSIDEKNMIYILDKISSYSSGIIGEVKAVILSYPKEKLNTIAKEIIQTGKLDLFEFLPEDALPKIKLDTKVIIEFLSRIRNAPTYDYDRKIKYLFKFNIDFKDMPVLFEPLTYLDRSAKSSLLRRIETIIKSFSNDELKYLAPFALNTGQFDLLNLFPDDMIPKYKLDKYILEKFIIQFEKDPNLPGLSPLFKFPIDSKDILFLLEKLQNPRISLILSSDSPAMKDHIAIIKSGISKQLDQKDMQQFIQSSFNTSQFEVLKFLLADATIRPPIQRNMIEKYLNTIQSTYSIQYEDKLNLLFRFKLDAKDFVFVLETLLRDSGISLSRMSNQIKDFLKSYSKQDLMYLASSALKMGNIEMLSLFPEETLPKEKLDNSTIEKLFIQFERKPTLQALSGIFKFPMDSKDLLFLLEKMSDKRYDILRPPIPGSNDSPENLQQKASIRTNISKQLDQKDMERFINFTFQTSHQFDLLNFILEDKVVKPKIERNTLEKFINLMESKSAYEYANEFNVIFRFKITASDLILVLKSLSRQIWSNSISIQLQEYLKSYSKEDLSYLASNVIKMGSLNLLSLFPDDAIPKDKLDRQSVEGFCTQLVKSPSLDSLIAILKFPMDSKDVSFILEKIQVSNFEYSLRYYLRDLVNHNKIDKIRNSISTHMDQKEINQFIISSLNSQRWHALHVIPSHHKTQIEISATDFDTYINNISRSGSQTEKQFLAISTLLKFKLSEEQIKLLISTKFPTLQGDTLIVWAAYLNDVETTQFLISQGHNPNSAEVSTTKTLIELAIERRNLKMVEMLLDNGVKINTRFTNGKTVLDYAILVGADEVVKSVLNRGEFDLAAINSAIDLLKTINPALPYTSSASFSADTLKKIELLLTEEKAKLLKSEDNISLGVKRI